MDYYSYASTTGVFRQTIFGVRDATTNTYSLRFHHNTDDNIFNMRVTPLLASPSMEEYIVLNETMNTLISVPIGNFNAILNNL